MRRLRHFFAWLGGIACIALGVAIIAAFAARAILVPRLEHDLLVTHSPATATPATFGVPYASRTLDSHGRRLQAWMVDAGTHSPALLLFHGDGETIRDFARVQAYLFRHHVSSMSFDYSGFGASTGSATVRHLNEDARAAWHEFVQWAGNAHPKFIFAYSLGTGIALHNVPSFSPKPLGVAVYGAFSNARDIVSYISPGLPTWLKPVMPDLWDNVRAAMHLREPLLVVAGMDDTNVPPGMGRRIALFAESDNRGSHFVLIPGADHGSIVAPDGMDATWAPILAFVRGLSLPASAAGAARDASAARRTTTAVRP